MKKSLKNLKIMDIFNDYVDCCVKKIDETM